MLTPERDCDYRCEGCQRVICADAEVSPGERDHICRDCYETEDDA